MLQSTNYFWRAYLERPIWETILRTRGPWGVNWGSIGRPYQMNFKNLESSLGQLSKFGELIVPALQIETLKSIYWSLSNVHQASGSGATHRSEITKKVHKPLRNHYIEWTVFSDIGLNCESQGEKGRTWKKYKTIIGYQVSFFFSYMLSLFHPGIC